MDVLSKYGLSDGRKWDTMEEKNVVSSVVANTPRLNIDKLNLIACFFYNYPI